MGGSWHGLKALEAREAPQASQELQDLQLGPVQDLCTKLGSHEVLEVRASKHAVCSWTLQPLEALDPSQRAGWGLQGLWHGASQVQTLQQD